MRERERAFLPMTNSVALYYRIEITWFVCMFSFFYLVLLATISNDAIPILIQYISRRKLNRNRSLMQTSSLHFLMPFWFLKWCSAIDIDDIISVTCKSNLFIFCEVNVCVAKDKIQFQRFHVICLQWIWLLCVSHALKSHNIIAFVFYCFWFN